MGQQLYQRMADDLRQQLVQDSSTALPSILELSTRYGAAYKTARKAIGVLVNEGLVTSHQGRRPRRAGGFTSTPSTLPASARRVCDDLRSGIAHGIHAVGDQLPKLHALTTRYGVSRATIVRAIAALAAERLVVKRGRQWVVGRALTESIFGSTTPAPKRLRQLVVLCLRDEAAWYWTFHAPTYAPFLSMFRGEMAKLGVDVVTVLRQRWRVAQTPLLCGIKEVREMLRARNQEYLGALFWELDPETAPFIEWTHALSMNGTRPVVYFDSADIRPLLNRTSQKFHSKYYRCHLDEPAAVRLALDALVKAGHSTIGFPTYGKRSYDWAERRLACVQSIASGTPIRIVTSTLNEPFWLAPESAEVDFNLFVDRVGDAFGRPNNGPTISSPRRSALLLRRTPSMGSLLDQGMTALMAMHDNSALQHVLWCRMASIGIPRDLSMVSFDNLGESDFARVSSVDFGLTRLGYSAAHAITQDIPVACTIDGNIASVPILVDRDSIAAA